MADSAASGCARSRSRACSAICSSDGSISVHGQGRMNVGQALDRDAVLDDIELVTGKRPAGSRYDERKWSIVLPMELTSVDHDAARRARRQADRPGADATGVRARRALPRRRWCGSSSAGCSAPTATARPCASAAPRSTKRRSSSPAYSQSALPRACRSAEETMSDIVALLVPLRRASERREGVRVPDAPLRVDVSGPAGRHRTNRSAARRFPTACRSSSASASATASTSAARERGRRLLANDR